MFGNKKEKQSNSASVDSSSRNIIGKNTKVVGDVIADGDFRIDGTLEGTLKTKGRVIIGQTGYIDGKVECSNADVQGKFSGNFIVHDMLTAKSTSVITGEVMVGQISTEPGANFNASCNMRSSKSIENTITRKKSEEKNPLLTH